MYVIDMIRMYALAQLLLEKAKTIPFYLDRSLDGSADNSNRLQVQVYLDYLALMAENSSNSIVRRTIENKLNLLTEDFKMVEEKDREAIEKTQRSLDKTMQGIELMVYQAKLEYSYFERKKQSSEMTNAEHFERKVELLETLLELIGRKSPIAKP